jgi:hypothetical protein
LSCNPAKLPKIQRQTQEVPTRARGATASETKTEPRARKDDSLFVKSTNPLISQSNIANISSSILQHGSKLELRYGDNHSTMI